MQQAAPLVQTRTDFLEHLAQQGHAQATIRTVARDILGVAEHIDLTPPAKVTQGVIEAAATFRRAS
jgi:hypothetical protein